MPGLWNISKLTGRTDTSGKRVDCVYRMTEAELAALLRQNPSLHVNKANRQDKIAPRGNNKHTLRDKSKFDSYAEQLFYEREVSQRLLTGEITQVELHRRFVLLPAVEACGIKCKEKAYTPDFVIHYADERVEVVEIKGSKVKRLQRDFELRKHLFIVNICRPQGWTYPAG